jgi:hypothetical protein
MSSELKKTYIEASLILLSFKTMKNQDRRITAFIQMFFPLQNRLDPGELSQIDVPNEKFANFVFTVV